MKRKKPDFYPPLKMIHQYVEKKGVVWSELDYIRNLLRRKYPVPDDIYITLYETLYAMNYNKVQKEDERLEAVKDATIVSALASWRISKEVYTFSERMEELLYAQAGDFRLPVEVLQRMPYPCIYIEAGHLQEDKYHGFFVYFDTTIDREFYLRFLVIDWEAKEFETRTIEITDGKTVKEGLEAPLRKQHMGLEGEVLESRVEKEIEEYRALTEKMLQLVLYICAENADISINDTQKASRKISSPELVKDKYREVRQWDVGFRVVKKLNKNIIGKDSPKADAQELSLQKGEQKRNSPLPHLRRGHWHAFWTGKRDGTEERKLIFKWIPFTYVNVGNVEEMPVTINYIDK